MNHRGALRGEFYYFEGFFILCLFVVVFPELIRWSLRCFYSFGVIKVYTNEIVDMQ